MQDYRKRVRDYYSKDLILNDEAHGLKHCNMVYKKMVDMNRYFNYEVDIKTITVLAYIHDLKCHIDRKNHHTLSALYVMNNADIDPILCELYNIEEIVDAIMQHRSSGCKDNGSFKFSSNAGRLLYLADKDEPNIEVIVKRSLEYDPDIMKVFDHIKDKFSRTGYLKYPEEYIGYYGKERINELHDIIDRLTIHDIADIKKLYKL